MQAVLPGIFYLPLPDGMHLDYLLVPHLSDLFTESDMYPLLETRQKNASAVGYMWALLSPSVDMALSECTGRHSLSTDSAFT